MIRIRVGVILVKDGKILLIKHSKGKKSYWLLPGGGVKFGETLTQCACRELMEETNLEIKLCNLLYIIESISKNEKKHIINLIFNGEITGGTPVLGQEKRLSELKFVSLEDLNNLILYPPINSIIIKLIESGFTTPEQIYLGPMWS